MNSARSVPMHSIELSSQRKRDLLDHFEGNSEELDRWREFNAAYHDDDRKFMRFLIPPGKRVLELGCGRGDLLAALEPSYGVGVDFGARRSRRRKPVIPICISFWATSRIRRRWPIEGPFDYIVIADTIGMFEDIDGTLRLVQQLCSPSTRIIIAYYSHLWEPVLKLAEALACAASSRNQLYRHRRLPEPDGPRRFRGDQARAAPIAAAALVRAWAIYQSVYRAIAGDQAAVPSDIHHRTPGPHFPDRKFSASIVIPCRNERGNIESAIAHAEVRLRQEILFVEGNSNDGTFEECERVRDAYEDSWDIRVLKQDGKGKGDAVRKGFAAATGDVLMILDADLTMPPEALPKYHAVIETGKAEFVNGTRLVYPMENEAMRPLNLIANRCFAYMFSYLVNTR